MNKPLTYEECFESAKKYTYWIDFINNDHSVYNRAYRKSWLKDYTWLKRKERPVYKEPGAKCVVYGIFDKKARKCYIGTTVQKRMGCRDHTVKVFFGGSIPKSIELYRCDSLSLAKKKRDEFKYTYNEIGYEVFAYKEERINDPVEYEAPVEEPYKNKAYSVNASFDHENLKYYMYVTTATSDAVALEHVKDYFNRFGIDMAKPDVLNMGLSYSEANSLMSIYKHLYEFCGYEEVTETTPIPKKMGRPRIRFVQKPAATFRKTTPFVDNGVTLDNVTVNNGVVWKDNRLVMG